MRIESAHAFFDILATHGREPRLADAVGTWEFDIEGVGTWTVMVDRGALAVVVGPSGAVPAGTGPTTRVRLREDELLRLVHGDAHENLLTALLRGALVVEGDLAFGAAANTFFPLPDEWRVGT